MDDKKDFLNWIKVKQKLHRLGKLPKISEREVWWCGVGCNVGVEIDGKSRAFSRPILVFKKLSKSAFLGIPLTTKHKGGSWYVSFLFGSQKENAVLSQAKVVSVSRLYDKIGKIKEKDFLRIKKAFHILYC